jgi:hypothetical protein
VVALLGAFRAEKGAAHYDAVVRAALAYDAAVEVDAQVGEGQGPDGSDALARELHSAWDGHERVRLHGGFLEPDEYDGVIARTDVVVLPYDVGAYGTGTSGILHEVLTAGGVVLTTPIEWATSEYGDHPRVRFLTATDPPTIEREVGAALELAARTRGDAAASGPPPDDEFVARWREAVDAAARWTSPR